MPRLTSIEKGGYYAFPDEHLTAVASLVAPSKQGGKLLDPCAGEGRALDYLARAWNLTPYANELDDRRVAACKALLAAPSAAAPLVVQGDLYQLKASNASFSCLWVNPPYTWDSTSNEKRRELGMLKHSWKWAQPGGLVFWIVYSHHLSLDAALFLSKNSTQVDVWRLPGLHLGEYAQIVVAARVGKPADLEFVPAGAAQLVQTIQSGGARDLIQQVSSRYALPVPMPRKHFVFCPRVVSDDAALAAIAEGGVQFTAGIRALVDPQRPPDKITPVVQPRGGQLALILAAGLFNGLVLSTGTGRMAVRSTVESVEVLTSGDGEVDEEDESTIEREVYRTQSVVTVTLLGEDGAVEDISGDAAMSSFIKTYKAALLAYLETHFKPLYDFDYAPLRPILARSKGGRLYPTQKHVIAACVRALEQRRSAILVGEPGSGKSIMGATVAAAMQQHMQPGQVVLVMCPPHLVEKWEREVRDTGIRCQVSILRTVEDVVRLMEQAARQPAPLLSVGILSRETAKLGEGWAVAVHWQQARLARWRAGEPRPDYLDGDRVYVRQQPLCPTCGTLVTDDGSPSPGQADRRGKRQPRGGKPAQPADSVTPASLTWLKRVPRFCAHCGGALWTKERTFSSGKRIAGHLKTPRTPLAEFIATRYPGRVYLYIADELHELKSAATDQGEAMTVLANSAEKTLGLTGTLYGGQASTLYAIEYLFNPRIRTHYPWGRGLNQWVRDMGVLERIVEYRPQYDKAGVYSGKRRNEQKPREAPGCSPLLVAEIIDHCVFVGLADMGKQMPAFDEIPVPLAPDPDVAALYNEAKLQLGQYLFQRRLEGDASALGMYLQALLSWPNAPYRDEHCVHRRRTDRDADTFIDVPVHTIPGLDGQRLFGKEDWLIQTVREELAEGRGVAVFCRQTGTRDIQPRVVQLISDHIPLAKPYILRSSVKADQRERVLNHQVAVGCNVLVCNPRLVQTGLDLLDFPTIIFFEVDYSLYVMGQASRRAWRLIQERPCKVYYPYYEGMMEQQAVELIGRKQQAAALLYSENTGTGLSALHGEEGGNLLATLAQEIGSDATVTDLRDLFARHTAAPDGADSAWWSGEGETADPDLICTTVLEVEALPISPLPSLGDAQTLDVASGTDRELLESAAPRTTTAAAEPPVQPALALETAETPAPTRISPRGSTGGSAATGQDPLRRLLATGGDERLSMPTVDLSFLRSPARPPGMVAVSQSARAAPMEREREQNGGSQLPPSLSEHPSTHMGEDSATLPLAASPAPLAAPDLSRTGTHTATPAKRDGTVHGKQRPILPAAAAHPPAAQQLALF